MDKSHGSEKSTLGKLKCKIQEIIEALCVIHETGKKNYKKLKEIKCLVREDLEIDRKTLEIVKEINEAIKIANGFIIRINQAVIETQAVVNQIQATVNDIQATVNTINDTVNQINVIVGEINNKIDQILALQCTPIDSIPFDITAPGCYKVTSELASVADGDLGINVLVDDVIILGSNFTVFMSGRGATRAVNLNERSNITVRDLNFVGNSDRTTNLGSRAIATFGGSNLVFDHLHTQFFNRGLSLDNVSAVTVKDSLLEEHISDDALSSGITILGTGTGYILENVRIRRCNTQLVQNRGMVIQPVAGRLSNIQIIGCQFEDAIVFVATFDSVFGILNTLFERCQFSVTDPDYKGWHILYGAEVGGQPNKTLTVRNCQFTNPNASIFFEPLLVYQGNGVTIENNDFYSNSPGNDIEEGHIQAALIHLGNSITSVIRFENIPEAFAINVTVRNCRLNGGNQDSNRRQNLGIYIENNSDGVIIDSTEIRNTGQGAIAPPAATEPVAAAATTGPAEFAVAAGATEDSTEPVAVKEPIALKPLKSRRHAYMQMADEPEPILKRVVSQPAKSQKKLSPKIMAALAKRPSSPVAQPPTIPDQRAAGILVDGAVGVTIRRTTVFNALAATEFGKIGGSGIVFSGQLEFQTIPALVPPGEDPLTIVVGASQDCRVIEKSVSSFNGSTGIIDQGLNNTVSDSIIEDNLDGLIAPSVGGRYLRNNSSQNFTNGFNFDGAALPYVEANIASQNAGSGFFATAFTTNLIALNNSSGGNGTSEYVGFPAVVNQGDPPVAGQNVQVVVV